MFSKETHTALKQTLNGIIQITKYCKDELGISYISPGKFQTDDLESRFSFYRQLAGSQYNISLQQLFECENKLRVQSALRLKLKTKTFGEIELRDFAFESDIIDIEDVDNDFITIRVEPSDIPNAKTYVPVLIYLAGYCVHSVFKRKKCLSCKELHLLDKELSLNIDYDFLKNLDRGSLMFPQEHVVNTVLYNYIVLNKLCFEYETKFLNMQKHRNIATSIALSLVNENDIVQFDVFCENLHNVSNFIKKVIWISTNILSNNFCKKKNDKVVSASRQKKKKSYNDTLCKKRKLDTRKSA